MPVLGAAAFAASKVSYGVLESDSLSGEVVETATKNNYVPMIAIIMSIVLLVVMIVILKKRSSKKSDSKPKKTNLVLADDDSGMSIDNFDFDDSFDDSFER